MSGSAFVTGSASFTAIGYIYGEEWDNVATQTNVWNDISGASYEDQYVLFGYWDYGYAFYDINKKDLWTDIAAPTEQWTDVINSDPTKQYVLEKYWRYGYADGDLFDSDIWTKTTTGSNQWLQQ
jgi:hypothetical protein